MKAKFLSALFISALMSVACEPQVGPDYTGEVLLHVEGDVELQNDEQAELEPMLYFPTETGRVVIPGSVEGVFPSEFSFSVTEQPPAEALVEGLAIGFIALMPADTPREQAMPRNSEVFFLGCESQEDSGSCEVSGEFCAGEDACVSRSYACEAIECEVVEESGDEKVFQEIYPDGSQQYSQLDCNQGFCTTQLEVCNEEDECFRQFRQCEYTEAPGIELTTGGKDVFECRLTEEEGPSELEGLSDGVPSATNYLVMYVSQDATPEATARFDLPELEAGYYLLAIEGESPQELRASANCRMDAAFEARDEYNAEHGTDYKYYSPDTPDDVREEMEEQRDARIEAHCEQAALVLVDPSETNVQLQIGRPPNM